MWVGYVVQEGIFGSASVPFPVNIPWRECLLWLVRFVFELHRLEAALKALVHFCLLRKWYFPRN